MQIYPDGRLAFNDLRDSVSWNRPCFLSLAGRTDVLVRFQRDAVQKRIVCESWNFDGSGYQRDQDTITASPAWTLSGGNLGSNNTSASLGFLRVFKSIVPDGSQPPTGWNAGDWTELKFDGTLADASGNGHNVTVTGGSYIRHAGVTSGGVGQRVRGPGVEQVLDFASRVSSASGRFGQLFAITPNLTYKWQQVDGPTTVRWSDTTSSTLPSKGLFSGRINSGCR